MALDDAARPRRARGGAGQTCSYSIVSPSPAFSCTCLWHLENDEGPPAVFGVLIEAADHDWSNRPSRRAERSIPLVISRDAPPAKEKNEKFQSPHVEQLGSMPGPTGCSSLAVVTPPRHLLHSSWRCRSSIMAFANGLLSHRGEREDDVTDHIESDTPSDRATPQPDLSDKRLPGIMHNSYFGQVGSGSSTSPASSGHYSDPLQTPALGSEPESPAATSPLEESVDDYILLSVAPDSRRDAARGDHEKTKSEEALPFLAHERPELPQASTLARGLYSFPTLSLSQMLSLYKLGDASSDGNERGASTASHAQRKSLTDAVSSLSRRGSFVRRASLNPLSSIVTTSNVHAAHFSNPSGRHPTSTPATPVVSCNEYDFLRESASIELLKRLTDDASRTKSIPPTPTRTSSNTAASDGSDHAQEKNGKVSSGEGTPGQALTVASAVPPVKSPKGKLTVKISGARGLRKSKDPYVVAVFQRNELVSSGPRDEDRDENEDATSSPMGGIPIMRSASDSGRAMAIPMKSRQSSNNSSSTDHRDFKGRPPTSNPTWDTEAVL